MERQKLLQHDPMQISEDTLVQRINRKLKPKGLRLRKGNGKKQIQQVGEYFILDLVSLTGSYIYAKHIDLAEYGRSIGCLASHEVIEK